MYKTYLRSYPFVMSDFFWITGAIIAPAAILIPKMTLYRVGQKMKELVTHVYGDTEKVFSIYQNVQFFTRLRLAFRMSSVITYNSETEVSKWSGFWHTIYMVTWKIILNLDQWSTAASNKYTVDTKTTYATNCTTLYRFYHILTAQQVGYRYEPTALHVCMSENCANRLSQIHTMFSVTNQCWRASRDRI